MRRVPIADAVLHAPLADAHEPPKSPQARVGEEMGRVRRERGAAQFLVLGIAPGAVAAATT